MTGMQERVQPVSATLYLFQKDGVCAMASRKRIYYTDAQKAEMWDRWQKGETLHSIARLFDRHHTSVRGILAANGGMRWHVS